jgi:hypothetical protein
MEYLHPSLGSKAPHEGPNKSSPHEHMSTGQGPVIAQSVLA